MKSPYRTYVPVLSALVLNVAVIGCSTDSSAETAPRPPIVPNQYEIEPVPVEAVRLYRSNELAAPTGLAILGDYLLVVDPYSSPMIHLIDRWTGRLVRRFGSEGAGPGEYEFPRGVTSNGTDTAWISDAALGRLTVLVLSEILSGASHSNIVLAPEFRGDIARLATGGFVGSDYTGTSRFIFFEGDRNGAVSRHGSPPVPPDGVPLGVAARAEAELVAAHPHTGRLAAAGVWTGQVSIYAPGDSITTAESPIPLSLEYTVSPDRLRPTLRPAPDSRRGYVGIAATEEHILAVFSGRSLQHGEDATAGEDIHIYDWSGHLDGIFRVDSDLIRIAVDPASGIVYGTRWGLSPAVVRFHLSMLTSGEP